MAYCPEEEPGIFWILDLISGEAQGHGLVHFLLISASELGFAWDGEEKGWVRVSLPPLRQAPSNTFTLLFWMPGVIVSLPDYPRVFFGGWVC